jgi:pimeloyl-ACP methyl ester carboxylesterase
VSEVRRIRSDDGVDLACLVDDFVDAWRPRRSVLLLHGACGSHRRFTGWVPALARHRRMLRLDMRGHGLSAVPPPESPLDMPRLVADVVQVLDALGCEEVDVIGASAGGYVAQHLALAHPSRVRSLLLFGASAGLRNTAAEGWPARIRAEGLRAFLATTLPSRFNPDLTEPGVTEFFLDDCARTDPDFAGRFIALMGTLEWSDRLPEIRCPVLLAIPGHEEIGGADPYSIMRARLPDVDVLTYAGHRHNFFDALPDRCAADALAFLRRRFGDDR